MSFKRLLIVLTLLLIAAPLYAGGRLVVCDDVQQPASLNPYRVFSEKAHTLLQQMLEGLVRFGPDGRVEPALAESWERIDENRVRFHLRRGVRFHNGEPLNAAAVRFSIERYLDPEVGYPGAGFIYTLDHVEVVDEHTVDVVTSEPDGLLLNRLAAWLHIVPPRYFQEAGGAGFADHPVGTGPFRFERWEDGRRVVLSANPDYWMEGLPTLDALEFRFAPADRQVELLLSGEVDLVTELPGTMTMAVEAAGHTRVLKQRTFWTVGATMDTSSGPLSDVRVRRALNLAIDREDLVRYGSRGNASVLASLTMPGQAGHNAELEPYPHDPERARRLLDEAGVERPLVLRTQVRAQAVRTARILAVQLAKVGVRLDIQAVQSDAEVIRGLRSQPWDIGIAGLPDPMCHSYFIHSVLLSSQSPFSLHKDAETDRRIHEMAQALDPARRRRLARELDRYVHEQALSLFTYQKIKTYGLRKDVAFTPYISGMPYYFRADAPEESRDGGRPGGGDARVLSILPWGRSTGAMGNRELVRGFARPAHGQAPKTPLAHATHEESR